MGRRPLICSSLFLWDAHGGHWLTPSSFQDNGPLSSVCSGQSLLIMGAHQNHLRNLENTPRLGPNPENLMRKDRSFTSVTGGRKLRFFSQVQIKRSILFLPVEVARKDQLETGLEGRTLNWRAYSLPQTLHSFDKHLRDINCVPGTLRHPGMEAECPAPKEFTEWNQTTVKVLARFSQRGDG